MREITIPDVPSGGTLHVVSKALGRVNTGSTCTTPGCAPIVQGEDSKGGTPAGRIVISRNEVLMDRSSGVIEGPTSVSRPGNLKPGWEEQIFLINRLIKPKSVLIANIEDFGGSNGLPMVQAVRVHPAGGRATFVIRNIATHPADQVDGRYSVTWSIFN